MVILSPQPLNIFMTIFFTLSVSNIARAFLKLKQHFSKSNRLHKIFKENMEKVHYSCMSKSNTSLII